jgi:hypothetical protein
MLHQRCRDDGRGERAVATLLLTRAKAATAASSLCGFLPAVLEVGDGIPAPAGEGGVIAAGAAALTG